MDPYPFIFSNKPRRRLQRHLAFWISWWMVQAFLYSFVKDAYHTTYFTGLKISTVDACGFMVPHIFLGYTLMYIVIPGFLLKEKYLLSVVISLLLFVATGAISALMGLEILPHVRVLLLGPLYEYPDHTSGELTFYLSLLAGLRGAVTVGGVAAAIKLMKYWYVKQARNLQLQKENIAAQLQLLKAQVHPHFLFNTLNNVYAHAQMGSASAPQLIAGLSDLLRYMLYECNQPLVPLSKELKMVEDYFLLERVRYGNKLEINLQLPADTRHLFIAPLVLLPFVENCFKHGASHMIDQPWVSLQIVIEDDWLKMKLLNGKPPDTLRSPGGIGIANARQRLEWIYPQKHLLSINNEEEIFIVNLKLQLERRAAQEAGPVKYANNKNHEFAEPSLHPVSDRG